MGIFSKSKVGISRKRVETWPRESVLRWLTYLGMEKYADNFKAITGQRLLQLSAADLYQLVDRKLDADLLLDGIQELRAREGWKPMAVCVAPTSPGSLSHLIPNAFLNPWNGASAGPSPVNSITDKLKTLPPLNTSLNGDGRHTTSRPASSGTPAASSSTGARTPASGSTPPAPRGTAENAELLSSLVGNHEVVTELFSYMSQLGIQGMGLVEATERSPIIGHIVGALWELHDHVQNAKANRSNCLQLDLYGQSILRVFDAEGKRLAYISSAALDKTLQFIEEGISLVLNCSRPGWLLRMANSERTMEEFQNVHNGILEQLRAEKVDTLPNGRQLTYGEYRDMCRPLRRTLKQLGSGSLDAGLSAVMTRDDAMNEVAQLIGIDKQAIMKDLQHLQGQPELEHMSTPGTSIGTGGDHSPMSPVGGRSKEYQTIFAQYDKNQSGALEFDELRAVLADLGLLDGIKPTEIENYTLQQFEAADTDHDGRVEYDDFVNFYQALSTTKARRELRGALGPQAEKDLKKIFCSFASFGSRQQVEEMDGAKFSKLCRDCKLLGRNFTTIDVDLIFAKTKVKGQRRVDFDGFLAALARIAEKKGQGLDKVVRQILAAGGPTVTGTKAEYVKFHDDKSTYTGVYARGGPTNVDPSKELSALLDRSEADVRGIKKTSSNASVMSDASLTARGTTPSRQASSTGDHASPRPNSLASNGRRESGSGGLPPIPRASGSGERSNLASASITPPVTMQNPRHSAARSSADGMSPQAAASPAITPKVPSLALEPVSKEDLKTVFATFASFGSRAAQSGPVEMDGAKFAKLCRESGLLNGQVTSTSVDIIFSKVKAKGARKITFRDFEKALGLLATEKGVSVEAVQAAVVASGGPQRNSTTPAANVRLHDDKSTYTGVYAKGGPSTVDKVITLQSLTDRTNTPQLHSARPRMSI